MNISHNSPIDMAKSLATYMSSPRRIRSEVLSTYGTSPCLAAIQGYRASYQRQKMAMKADREFDRSVLASDERYAAHMEHASAEMVRRLFNERCPA